MTVPARPPATRLGDMPVTRFLQRHWQRRPLVTRQALPGLLADGFEVDLRRPQRAGRPWVLDVQPA